MGDRYMEQCFSLYFNNTEILLPKKDITFIGDLGLVKVYFNSMVANFFYNDYLVGVIDKNFNEVVPLFSVGRLGRIEIFDNGVLLCINKGITKDLYRIYQIEKVNDKVVWNSLPFLYFASVSSNVFKIQMDIEGNIVEALYDASKKELISKFFHSIDSFVYNENLKEIVAEASYYLPYNEEQFNQIKTYINVKGEVVAPYLDCNQNKIYDANMDFREIIMAVAQDMKGKSR